MPVLFHADAAFLSGDRIVRDAAVLVDEQGVILDAGIFAEVTSRSEIPETRVHGFLLPGLINAHVHVELTALRGRIPGGEGFLPWLSHLIALRKHLTPEETKEATLRAAREITATGTACVGEVTNTEETTGALATAGLSGSIFHEVFGFDEHRLEKQVDELRHAHRARHASLPRSFSYSITPHTMYTTPHRVVVELMNHLEKRGELGSIHWLEHPAERAWLEGGTGPLASFYAERLGDSSFPAPHRYAKRVAKEAHILGPHCLLVHLTEATDEELAQVRDSNAPLVLCPRSNRFIENKLPPLDRMMRLGLRPSLGTDSLASNASLDLLTEARTLGEAFPDVPKEFLLSMLTAHGADALRRPGLGRIEKGAAPGVLLLSPQNREDESLLAKSPGDFAIHAKDPLRSWLVRKTKYSEIAL